MAGGVTLQVRQLSSYPVVGAAGLGDILLMQPGGLGNPYASIDAQTFVATALSGGSLGVGETVLANAAAGNIFSDTLVLPNEGVIFWNAFNATGGYQYWQSGLAGAASFGNSGFALSLAPPGEAGNPVGFYPVFEVNQAGSAALPLGTLTVARDPGAALEVATMGWVGRNTATSFNGRQGAITLNGCDIYSALCLDSTIATENWVNANIQASIQMLLANHPFVFGWNGRTGAVYLTLADISCVFFQPGQQPITQTPPLTSNDYSIPNTQWVVEYIANEFAGGGSTLATQAWVLANTVNSFNGRMGVVTLTSSDVFDVGAAPLNSPAFSGIPTAPTAAVGQATGQIATTAFVQQAITNNTAGVSTFNTRTGDVVLTAGDVTAAGGLTNPSAALTGVPTCPTQPPGTNLPVIANCEFVMAAIAAGTVTSFNTRTGAVTLTLADITGVGGAPLVSPAFSSVPTAPTAAPGTATVQLATCAFVANALATAGGVSSFNSRTGAVDLIANDISAAGGLVNPSVNLTGSPTATTATAGDNSTRIATTAFVTTALSSGAVSSFNTRTGAVTLQGADITAAGGALLASPAFTGAPTAPTAAPATNNTQIATTAYVTAAILADTTGVTSFNTRTGAVVLTTADITGAGGAPLASPSFTGVPLGPTATAGTSTTQLATTAFVQAAIASSGVSSFNARTGAVTLIANDISAAGGALLAGPTFTGVPAAPTAAPGTNTTQLATTAFVAAAIASGGPYLPLSGGTLTGPLTLSGNATANLQAVPLQQLPNLAGNIGVQGSANISWNALSVSGNFQYILANAAATAALINNQLVFSVAAPGAAGATITNFVQTLTMSPGALGVPGTLQVNGSSGLQAITCTTIGATGAITSGSHTVTGNMIASALVQSSGGRIMSVATSNPSVVTFDTTQANGAGFFYGSSALMYFSAMNSSGSFTSLYGHFDTGGNLTITGTLSQGSDATNKTDIAPLTQGVGLIGRLIPKSFAWLTSPDITHWGFIAQDVQEVIPVAVGRTSTPDGSPGTLTLDETPIVATLTLAVQQLVSRIAALEAAAGITPPAESLA